MTTHHQAPSEGQRSPWQQAFPGGPVALTNTSHNATLSPPLLSSNSGHKYSDYTAPKISPSHVQASFSSGNTLANIMRSNTTSPSPNYFDNQSYQQAQQSHSGQNSPFVGNSYSFQPARPPISVMTSNPGTPSYQSNTFPDTTLAMPMPIAGASQAGHMGGHSSAAAYLAAGVLDPTSMVYDENSGGYATPSYVGSYADDSSFDDRRSHSPYHSRAHSRSPNPDNMNRRPSVSSQEPMFAKNASDLLAFRDSLSQGKSDWDDLSSHGGHDFASNARSSPSNHLSSPDLGARSQVPGLEGQGLEMAVERMFAPLPSPKLLPMREATTDTLRASSAPPPAYQALSAPGSARSVFTSSPAHSPVLRPQSIQITEVPAVPMLARYSPSPTTQGNLQQQQQHTIGQPSLRSPPLPNQLQQSGENKTASLAPLAIPDKPDLTLTTATPTAIPRTATGRQDSTQAALDTVFTFFQRSNQRQDSRDSTDSGPTSNLHAEAAHALFNNIPEHDLTLDVSASRDRQAAVRQRSKSDTYMTSPVTWEGPTYPFSGPSAAGRPTRQQSGGAIDPRALDGSSSPGWPNTSEKGNDASSSMAQGSVPSDLQLVKEHLLAADRPSEAGPSARRRSVVDTSPYISSHSHGAGSTLGHSMLAPPSSDSQRRSQSQGASHRRAALSEDYTASTSSPRNGHFNNHMLSERQNEPHPGPPMHSRNPQYSTQSRFIDGGYAPPLASHMQYDFSNLPPMPQAFPGQQNFYGPPSTMAGGYPNQMEAGAYGQMQNQPGYQGYGAPPSDPYGLHATNAFLQNYPSYMAPSDVMFHPADPKYANGGMLYPQMDDEYATGPDGMLDVGRMRRRSSVRSDTSGVSGLSGVSDFTYESKTTEATKQAARRRRKDPSAAKFVCEYCNETFTRAYNLKGHIRSHEGLKPFTCETCGKGFARRHDLKRHELLHSGVKKYMCEACQTPFVRLDALQRHHKSEAGAACIQQIAQMSGTNVEDLLQEHEQEQEVAEQGEGVQV